MPRLLHLAAGLLLGLLAAAAQAGPLDQPMPPETFQACIRDLAGQTARAQRPLARDDFLRIAGNASYDDRVRQSMLVQRGEPTFWWDDIAATTDDQRVAEGREVLTRGADTLQRIETRFGIPREIIVAIYGIETNYGPSQGSIPVLDAALSVACLRPCANPQGNCGARERAFSAVRLVRDGRMPPGGYPGSWAAAFGRTQFVPDSYEALAVDFDGDGVANIVESEGDAWATAANHLRTRGGWAAGVPVYVEVQVPPERRAEFTRAAGDRSAARWRKAADWAAGGWQAVTANGGTAALQLRPDAEMRAFLPVGLPGPAFLVSRNFDTIWRYNNSDRYVMEVAVLANRLAGGPGIVTPWPTDDPGLSRAQVRELQAWLQQQGHAQVLPDGVMGRLTRDAIEAERARKGMPPSRRVGQRTMRELMQP